ncbi:excalibur calcium-binding domain-containing protein [Nocardia pseudovaccinii]|uniref:excalibur calcium-binding domain-containing protein n=1 Tax=Nocardia pseudovaccinii TaxID=189540 RepID=UPI003D8CDF9F
MKPALHPRSLRGTASAILIASAAIVFAAPTATADPLTDLLCNSGSAQFCPPAQPQQNLPSNPPPQSQPPQVQPPQSPPPQTQPAPYYKNCDEVRRAGKAPLHRGDPGYASHLDRDNDGIACE